MPNHFHLVIYTKYADSLSQGMHWISSSSVRYYNKRYNISGHLWQGRYKSFIVQEDSYLLVLLKYVEANPKRARIVKDCIDYKYSSANNRIKNNENLITDEIPIDYDHLRELTNLRMLAKSDKWPRAVPEDLICPDDDEDQKLSRASGIVTEFKHALFLTNDGFFRIEE